MKPVSSWFKEYQLYQITLIYMSTRFFVNLAQSYIPLYIQVTLKLHANYLASVPLALFVSSFLTSFAMKNINEFFGRKITLIMGAVIGLTGCIWIQFGCQLDDPMVRYYIFGVAILIGKYHLKYWYQNLRTFFH